MFIAIVPVEPPLQKTSVVDVVNCGAGGTYAYIAELLDPQEFVAFTLIGPENAPKSTVILPVLSPEAIVLQMELSIRKNQNLQ